MPDFVDPPPGLLGAELPLGPSDAEIGKVLVRVLADSVVIARVENVSPYGGNGYVRLSDGTVRQTGLGRWYRLRETV